MTIMAEPESSTANDTEALHDRLLIIAERLLAAHGPDRFTLRELAREAGISTMGIYTVFGGKDGVMRTLYAAGFARLYTYAASAEDRSNPAKWLYDALFAYRRFALDHVGFYRLMFGGDKRFVPIARNTRFGTLVVPDQGAYPSYESLMDAFAEGQRQGVITSQRSADQLAHLAWAIIHGLVSLEIAGYVDLAHAQDRFADSVGLFVQSVLIDPTKLNALELRR